MNDPQQNEPRKGLPSNFVLFLIAAVLVVLMIQNFIDTKFAKVSFSYQLEHLVNLGLVQPEESRKTAINDNLVTFSGKFRDRLTEESKNRYKFLELLEKNHTLKNDLETTNEQLVSLRGRIVDAADLFLQVSGIRVPQGGYVVVDESFNTIDKDNSVVIASLPSRQNVNVRQVTGQLEKVQNSPTEENVGALGRDLAEILRQLRSPVLGIGDEKLKQGLREMQLELTNANQPNFTLEQKLLAYRKVATSTNQLVENLNQMEDHVRLGKVRSVRNFRKALEDYTVNSLALTDNKAQLDKTRQQVANVVWYFNNKELTTRALEKQDPETFEQWFLNAKEEWESFEENRGGYFKAPDQPLNTVLEKTFRSEEPPPKYLSYMFPVMIALAVVVVLYLLFARQVKGVGSNAMNFGKSTARMIDPKGENRVTFHDVAGIEEAKEELQEIVDFLKDPMKFTALGGRIPKGVLCVGPPGTGKTLIARAVSGEAERPFFFISGSDFVEMFVGVGASRIRDLFDQAKKHAPCIIFIDEIDAVGRHRGAGIGGGHDEREQTLNQLLVEMDGFDPNEGVIIMAATNRPDVLDKALLRPGRFDRQIIISLPDIKGRFDILKVHATKIKMHENVNLMDLARSTPGSSGADLANILNEAALLAARRGRTAVTNSEVRDARDKVLYGKERRSLEIDEHEKKTTAFHESGHAIVGLAVEHSDPIDKVTIIPRGMALGVTMFLPEKNKVSYWKKELVDRLAVLMGGRCAEEVFMGDICSGAQQDIEQATNLARAMVCEWGMSDKLGTVAYNERSDAGQYLGIGAHHEKKYSEATAQEIDAEVKRILHEAHEKALKIIKDFKIKVELMANMLIEFETLDNTDVKKIMDGSWDAEEKRGRLQAEIDLQKAPEMPPPPPVEPLPAEG